MIAYNSISGNWESSAAPPADISGNSINDLSDVDTSTAAPSDGQALVWDNTAQKWEPGTVSGGGTTLDSLDDVDTSTVAPTDGQALLWDNTASKWEPGTVVTSVNNQTGGAVSLGIEDMDDYGLNYNVGATAGTTTYGANNYSTTCGGYRWSVPESNKICFQRRGSGNVDYQSLYATIIANPTAYAIQINNGNSSGGVGSFVMYAQITSAVSDGSDGIILTHDGSYGPYLAGDTPPGTGNWNGYMKFAFIGSVVVPVTDGQVLAWDNTSSLWKAANLRTLLGIGEYADDAAAGTGGVASGALYYNTTSSDYRLKT